MINLKKIKNRNATNYIKKAQVLKWLKFKWNVAYSISTHSQTNWNNVKVLKWLEIKTN